MFTVLTTRFNITPTRSESLLDAYCRVKQIARDQILSATSDRDGVAALRWESQVNWHSTDGSMSLQWQEWQDTTNAQLALTDLRLAYIAKRVPWEVTVKFGANNEGICIHASWRWGGTPGIASPLRALPPLLRAYTAECCCSSDLSIPFSLHVLTAEDVHAFYMSVLMAPQRRIPIILVSPLQDDTPVVDDMGQMAQRLFGLALVYQFADHEAAQVFREIIGTSRACYDGVLRVYWPPDQRASSNPYWKIRRVWTAEFQVELFQLISESSRRNNEIPDALQYLEKQQWQEILGRAKRHEMDNGQLMAEWVSTVTENDQLKKQIREVVQQNRDLEARVVEIEDELRWWRNSSEAASTSDASDQESNTIPLDDDNGNPRLLLSPNAWQAYHGTSPDRRQEYQTELVKFWAEPELRRNQTKRVSKRKTACLIYPQGEKDFRLFYHGLPDGSIHVYELGDHDYYEDCLNTQRVHRDKYDVRDFAPWTFPLDSSASR
ncbi:MAG TPA: hypothetical protein VFW96_15785 [Thermomicrobiales bacterium]|nr:hypothetical protein [Thermomicrobiales bacterium]